MTIRGKNKFQDSKTSVESSAGLINLPSGESIAPAISQSTVRSPNSFWSRRSNHLSKVTWPEKKSSRVSSWAQMVQNRRFFFIFMKHYVFERLSGLDLSDRSHIESTHTTHEYYRLQEFPDDRTTLATKNLDFATRGCEGPITPKYFKIPQNPLKSSKFRFSRVF